MDHVTHLVLAQDLYPERLPGDEPEVLEVLPWRLDALDQLMLRDECSRWARPGSRPGSPAPAPRPSTACRATGRARSEEHTSELQSLMRISYAVFCLKKKHTKYTQHRGLD